jgi:subtilisin family serine protease
MKKIVSLLTFCFFIQFVNGQSKNYWIVFKDKVGTEYSIHHPEQFLSAKAIERRAKQNIKITNQDLPLSKVYIDAVSAACVQVVSKSKWFNAVYVKSSNPISLELIQSMTFVKSVKEIVVINKHELDSKFKAEEASFKSNSDSQPFKSGSGFNYGLSYIQANQIGANCMHTQGYVGQGMVIAVLDAGFYKADSLPAFDSLRINNQILGCRDFVTGDTLVYEDYPHGMNVLSCMGGNIHGSLVGTAPKAKYWLLRTEDAWSETLQEEINWAVGAEFADSVGADVINSSLGYSNFDNPADSHTYADMDGNTTIISNAADFAVSKGIFVTTSAGNAGGPPWYKITAPADADSVLTVGAVDSVGVLAGFSSRGPTFDGRIKPNVVARGYQAAFASASGGITQGNGTSFSSPITAGAVACLWQAHPTKTNMEILSAIEQSASQSSNPDSLVGYGIPNFCTASAILTGIEENNNSINVFTLYPNPFINLITITCNNSQKQLVRVSLIDISGREVFVENKLLESNTNTFTIKPETQLAKGLYILKIVSNSQSSSIKVIKD